MRRKSLYLVAIWSSLAVRLVAADGPATADLKQLNSQVLPDAQAARQIVRQDVRDRVKAANQRETANWRKLDSVAAWEKYRDQRIAALKQAVGTLPEIGSPVDVHVTSRIDGDGFTIDNITFQSRPDVLVTANLYRPKTQGENKSNSQSQEPLTPGSSPARGEGSKNKKQPGIIICHSHHAPKTQSELQDMGMCWARSGAMVLVMDQQGHGERRTHRFSKAEAYSGSFRPERQDYYFRYNTGVQLQLAGETLVGWIAGDLMRGVDVLLQQPNIDPERIVLLGAVAGGGDPAGVAAALDSRITAAVPFNFGGYEPEDVFPLPDDAEDTFNYAGGGSWESTRNIQLSARDGFMPWVIVGSVAPRRLIYAHEFRWDRERDPVWKRLQQIFSWEGASDRVGFALGRGTVKGQAPDASHCTNIGPVHRSQVHALLRDWLGMPVPTEVQTRRPSSELMCLPPGVGPKPLHEVIAELPQRASSSATPDFALEKLLEPLKTLPKPQSEVVGTQQVGRYTAERVRIDPPHQGPGQAIPLPLMLLHPTSGSTTSQSQEPKRVVLGICQAGKAALLKERSEMIAALLKRGAVVALVDLRGSGETEPDGEGRGRTSGSTSRSSTEWMLGETILGQRAEDLDNVIAYLGGRWPQCRVSLWGEGLVTANSPDRDLAAPLDAGDLPRQSEPLGMLVALIAANRHPDRVARVYAAGGLLGYGELLRSPYFYAPHDVLLPGILKLGDVPSWAARLAPRQLLLAELRDGQNREATGDQIRSFEFAAGQHLQAITSPPSAAVTAVWLTAGE